MTTSMTVSIFSGVIFLAILVILFFKQLKGLFLLVLNTALGWAGLYIFNLILPAFAIGINIASASIAGVLGLPGLVLLIILKTIYK